MERRKYKFGCNVDRLQLQKYDQALAYACEEKVGECCADINNLEDHICMYNQVEENDEACIDCWANFYLDKAQEDQEKDEK